MALLKGSVKAVSEMQSLIPQIFPYGKLSDASTSFVGTATSSENPVVSKAVVTTLDAVESLSDTCRTLEYFVQLHIPKIEDGGNFGVGVQLDLLKKLHETQEMLSKNVDELCAYSNARAEALSKVGLPSSSTSVTKSSSATTTDGKKEDKTSETTEEKESSSPATGPAYESRVSAVVAVDAMYYSKARKIFNQCLLSFLSAMDFMDKNKDKLIKPKGSGGMGHGSMY
jgi:Proteasome activator pa28 beta subunit